MIVASSCGGGGGEVGGGDAFDLGRRGGVGGLVVAFAGGAASLGDLFVGGDEAVVVGGADGEFGDRGEAGELGLDGGRGEVAVRSELGSQGTVWP